MENQGKIQKNREKQRELVITQKKTLGNSTKCKKNTGKQGESEVNIEKHGKTGIITEI